mmetsp:Transcript_15404/g.26028  ORF Transcript_15404/g.26028 Transcript_15404/m.26028 type:complete len:321 (-) Transcript_15404:528-1490(-)
MLARHRDDLLDPFCAGQRMDIFSYVSWRRLVSKMLGSISNLAILEQEGSCLSETSWASRVEGPLVACNQGQFEHFFASLEDPRESSFKVSFHIAQSLNEDNDPSQLLGAQEGSWRAERLFLTPSLVEHFDLRGQHDYEVVSKLVRFQSMNLGFDLHETTTGNKEQQRQQHLKRDVVKFVCSINAQTTQSIRYVHHRRDLMLARGSLPQKFRKDPKRGKDKVLEREMEILEEARGRPLSEGELSEIRFKARAETILDELGEVGRCPFYVRFQREAAADPRSEYRLLDFVGSHSHPLALGEVYVTRAIRQNKKRGDLAGVRG